MDQHPLQLPQAITVSFQSFLLCSPSSDLAILYIEMLVVLTMLQPSLVASALGWLLCQRK